MSRSLVIARVGAGSLHPTWIDRDKPRDWDVHLLPFQPIPEHATADCTVSDVVPGPKWSGLRTLLNGWDGWREYDYVWLPDDDILAFHDDITRMFEVARAVGLDLFAPALHDASWYTHFDTMRNRSFYGRWAGFVEIMVPAFSRAALEELLPTLDLSDTGWGWGLDSLWPKRLDYRNVGIIDGTPVVHTRRVGRMRDPELRRSVVAESDRILADHDCTQVHAVFGAFGPDLRRLELTPCELLAQVIDGWHYLIEKDPRVLAWIVEFQQPRFEWPAYPITGYP